MTQDQTSSADEPAQRRGATVAQLRDDIDSGRTGDKVGGLDLAAAPLGTDDEAAGTPPSPEVIAHAREVEARMNTAKANAASPHITPNGAVGKGGKTPIVIGLVVAAIVAAAVIAVLL